MSPEKISKIRERYFHLMSGRSEVIIIDSLRPIKEISQTLIKSRDYLL